MANYKLTYGSKFKKDFKKFQKKPKELKALTEVLNMLIEGGASSLLEKMKAHKLIGNYKGLWECHILPDLLLIWDQEDEPINEIHLIRLGSHSELFS